MSTEPLDLAVIMAEHARDLRYPDPATPWCVVCDNPETGDPACWPCLPYRLAAENAALREDRDTWKGACMVLGEEAEEWREKAMAENAILVERTAQRDALRAAEQRVRKVHYKTDFGGWCGGCTHQRKDCPTLAALDGAE